MVHRGPDVRVLAIFQALTTAMNRLATALDVVIDCEKQAIRMFDIERANVYQKHLGEKLRKDG